MRPALLKQAKRSAVLPALILSLTALAGAAGAQTPPVQTNSNADFHVTCLQTGSYLLIVREPTGEGNAEFLVRRQEKPLPKGSCVFQPQASDYRIGGPDTPYALLAHGGRYLALTASTGPSGDLDIFDLETRKRVLHERYTAEGDPKEAGGKVAFTMRLAEATAKTCKNFRALTKDTGAAEIGMPASFDLKTGTLTKSGKQVCTTGQ